MRDIKYIVPLILRLWFYASPVFYAVENRVPERTLDIYMVMNPMAVFLGLFRAMFMNYNFPKPLHISAAVTAAVLMLSVGYLIFKKNEDLMVKRI